MSEPLDDYTLTERQQLHEIREYLFARGYSTHMVNNYPARIFKRSVEDIVEKDTRDGALAAIAAGAEPSSALAAGKEFARLMALRRKEDRE